MPNFVKFFCTIMDEWLAIEACEHTTDKVYYSVDGKNFMQLDVVGYSGYNSVKTKYTVENPHIGYGWKGNLLFNGEDFVLEREDSPHRPVFRPTDKLLPYELLSLPYIVELKGAYKLPDGRFVLWTGPKYDFTGKDIKFYFGEYDNIKEYSVHSFNGATLFTAAGNLFVYSPSFDGYKLLVLDRLRFKLEVDGDIIRLLHKK